MNSQRFQEITAKYAHLRIAVVGDFCLDRYLEIDPTLSEISIETGLPVYNVANVRAQPGGAGTVLNNLGALGVGTLLPVGFCGEDGDGYELQRAMAQVKGVKSDHFFPTAQRHTFTYCKPLILEANKPPRELNRLDTKNWQQTPESVSARMAESIAALRSAVDAVIVLDQVDQPGTGVVTAGVLRALEAFPAQIPVIADSRRGLRGFPPLCYKMNAAELRLMANLPDTSVDCVKSAVASVGAKNCRPVFVTLAERGIVGSDSNGHVTHIPALPVRGPIDIVGAGDCVTANLAAALAAGADVGEAMEIAMLASSIVIHQLGTTGTASVRQIAELRSITLPCS